MPELDVTTFPTVHAIIADAGDRAAYRLVEVLASCRAEHYAPIRTVHPTVKLHLPVIRALFNGRATGGERPSTDHRPARPRQSVSVEGTPGPRVPA